MLISCIEKANIHERRHLYAGEITALLLHHCDVDDTRAEQSFRDEVLALVWQGDELEQMEKSIAGFDRLLNLAMTMPDRTSTTSSPPMFGSRSRNRPFLPPKYAPSTYVRTAIRDATA